MVNKLHCYKSKISYGLLKRQQADVFMLGLPREKFVISRTSNGRTLSLYSDNVWDFSHYRPVTYLGTCAINFNSLRKNHIPTVKKIIFATLYLSENGSNSWSLKPSSIIGQFRSLKPVCDFADLNETSILEVLTNKVLFIELLRGLTKRSQATKLSNTLSHLLSADSQLSEIKGIQNWQITLCKLKSEKLKATNQTPIIPERIFSNLIKQLFQKTDDFEKHSNQIIALVKKMNVDSSYGRANCRQSFLGTLSTKRKPNFEKAVEIEGLTNYFTLHGVNDGRMLSSFLSSYQASVLNLIVVFSGMRKGEAATLKVDCIKKNRATGVTEILGYTSKGRKKLEKVSWITSPKIISAVKIASKLAAVFLEHEDVALSETPLFASPGSLSFGNRSGKMSKGSYIGASSTSAETFRKSLVPEELRIQAADLDFLNVVDPFRDWASEERFSLGQVWHFTPSQFRRSLAFYVAQSGIVSFSALKGQLKHVSVPMTLYYCQSHIAGGHNNSYFNDFHQFVLEIKPEADAAAYIKNILSSDEPLFGVAGRDVTNERLERGDFWILQDTRSKLVSQFEKGLMAYSVIPLGACTTISTCKKTPALSIAGCLNCKDAIIKPRSLDNTIESLETHVQNTQSNDTDNFVQRMDIEELAALKKYRTRIQERKLNGS